MPTLPIDTTNQQNGRRALAVAISFFEDLGILVRQESQETDFGSDLELEVHEERSLTGKIVKCQVKGTAGPAFLRDKEFDVSIKSSTQNYWAALPVNVICVLVDISNSAVYWQTPSASLVTTITTRLRFNSAKRADLVPDEFLRTLGRLSAMPTSSQVLSQIAPCLNLFSSVSMQSIAEYDRGFEVEPEIDAAIRILHDHVERLCIYAGIEDQPATWIRWERRNAVIQTLLDSNSTNLLDGNVAVEIVRYISTFYETALVRISECVDSAQLVDSIPQLANLKYSGALEKSAISDAFAEFKASGRFDLTHRNQYTFGQELSDSDRQFDAVLGSTGCSVYDISGPHG